MNYIHSNSLNNQKSFLAISFHGGKLKVFNFESKALMAEFKCSFGNIICIDYSNDGKLLGLGTESDEAYIIDAETNTFLYCLEGHKNYVSSIIFDEQISNDEDELDPSEDLKNNLNASNMDTIMTEYNSNVGNNNPAYSNNFINRTHTNGALNANIPNMNYFKLATRQINSMELIQNIREEEELFLAEKGAQNQHKVFDPKNLRRTRSHITTNNNIITNNNQHLLDLKECKIYDIYTSGYDGYLGVWRIEHFYESEAIVANTLNKFLADLNLNPKESNVLKKMISPKSILLSNSQDKIIFYTDFVKIQNIPIYSLKMIDNMIVMIGKRNNIGSSVFLKFFHGVIKSDEENEKLKNEKINPTEEAFDNGNINNSSTTSVHPNIKKKVSIVDSKYQELKQSSVHAKSTNSTTASTSYYEDREREGKDIRDKRRENNGDYNDYKSNNAPNKSPYKEKNK